MGLLAPTSLDARKGDAPDKRALFAPGASITLPGAAMPTENNESNWLTLLFRYGTFMEGV